MQDQARDQTPSLPLYVWTPLRIKGMTTTSQRDGTAAAARVGLNLSFCYLSGAVTSSSGTLISGLHDGPQLQCIANLQTNSSASPLPAPQGARLS